MAPTHFKIFKRKLSIRIYNTANMKRLKEEREKQRRPPSIRPAPNSGLLRASSANIRH